MSSEAREPWTAESIYDEQIAPLMDRIIALCTEHQIPMVAQFQYELHPEHGPGFVTTVLPFPRACDAIVHVAAMLAPSEEELRAEAARNGGGGT